MCFFQYILPFSSPGRQPFPTNNHMTTHTKEREREKGKERDSEEETGRGRAVGLFLICFVSCVFPLFYFKFEVRFARFVLLCLDGKVFTLCLLGCFLHSSPGGRCVFVVVKFGLCFFFALASFLF